MCLLWCLCHWELGRQQEKKWCCIILFPYNLQVYETYEFNSHLKLSYFTVVYSAQASFLFAVLIAWWTTNVVTKDKPEAPSSINRSGKFLYLSLQGSVCWGGDLALAYNEPFLNDRKSFRPALVLYQLHILKEAFNLIKFFLSVSATKVDELKAGSDGFFFPIWSSCQFFYLCLRKGKEFD